MISVEVVRSPPSSYGALRERVDDGEAKEEPFLHQRSVCLSLHGSRALRDGADADVPHCRRKHRESLPGPEASIYPGLYPPAALAMGSPGPLSLSKYVAR
ncbi:hypothetical protein AOLI_G00103510 [Acnodon oligacanthus]